MASMVSICRNEANVGNTSRNPNSENLLICFPKIYDFRNETNRSFIIHVYRSFTLLTIHTGTGKIKHLVETRADIEGPLVHSRNTFMARYYFN